MACYSFNNTTLIVTVDVKDPAVLAKAIVLSVTFLVSFIGVILNLTFICRKKTNFMVRTFIYYTLATTLQLGASWLTTILPCITIASTADSYILLDANVPLVLLSFNFIPSWAISILVFTINFTILTNVCCHTYCSRQNPCRNRSRLQLVCLELLFVVLVFVPSKLGAVIVGVTFASDWVSSAGKVVLPVALFSSLYLLPLVAPVSLSLIMALLTRYCQLRRRQIVRRTILLKEIGLFSLLLIGTVIIWAFSILSVFCNSTSILVTLSLLSVLIALSPLCLFVYMYRSFRTTTSKQVRVSKVENRNNLRTDTLQTIPPSTRVSLPTDTAEHAPNFLSPSTAETSYVEMSTVICHK